MATAPPQFAARKGLFFRGSEPLPFGRAIRPVAELLDYLLGTPQAATQAA